MAMHPCYLPPISWFRALVHGTDVDTLAPWEKQTLRSRCYIATATGPQALIVPVCHGAKPNAGADPSPLISDQARWRSMHWNAMQTSYRQSPFFEYYAPDLWPFYAEPRTESIYAYDIALTERLLHLMHAPELSALRKADKQKETQTDIQPYYQPYAQRTGFLADLSIIDLLFNLGPETYPYLLA